MAKKVGRPSIYNQKLVDTILQRIAEGESLRTICKEKDMPVVSTVLKWKLEKPEFSEQYDEARQSQVQHLFDELLEIADDSTSDTITKETKDGEAYEVTNQEAIARSRLRVDTRKWYLSKVAPKVYGDKLDLTSDGKELQPILVKFIDKDEETKDD